MTDINELFQRDPLNYTKESGELREIVAYFCTRRAQFNLGNLKAGSTKPLNEKQKEVLSLKDKLGGGFDL